MYRVAIIVNENETIHSVYADAESTIKRALKSAYGNKVDDLYSFEVFDKFNISNLFETGANNLSTFDSLFIATNACNNKEIDITLTKHLEEISLFIDDKKGNHHGVFISNQQKLGGNQEDAKNISFLPMQFTYRLVKRKEPKSSDGNVSIASKTDLLVNFPNRIDNATILRACSGIHNQFMPHKYRFIIEPAYDSTYETVYCDESYKNGNEVQSRPLLLKSRIGNERIVITSMVLDWAEHLEQLANIVVFITEGVNHFAFITKKKANDIVFSRFIKRALDYNIPLKKYDEVTLKIMLAAFSQIHNSKNASMIPHQIFVFSSMWSKEEVEKIWRDYIAVLNDDVSFYRLETDAFGEKEIFRLEGMFSKSIRNSQMFLCADEWLSANFLYSKWRKSIWTYEYVLDLYTYMKCDRISYAIPLVEEIHKHFKIEHKKNRKNTNISFSDNLNAEWFEKIELQSYDNVFNSTCACCNVLSKLYSLCKNNRLNRFSMNSESFDIEYINNLSIQFGNWILYRLDCKDYSKRISWQDYITAFVKIYDAGYIDYVKNIDSDLYDLVIRYAKCAYDLVLENVLKLLNSGISSLKDITNPDLCKALRFLYVYSLLKDFDVKEDVYKIEECLAFRQKYNGQWKNLSETAEIAISLVCREDYPLTIPRSPRFDKMVNRAVNFIQREYDTEKSCWLDDENTTAKSMNVILHYDDIYNFAYDDFLLDLVSNTNKTSQVVNVSNNISALDHAQSVNNKFHEQIVEQDKQNKKLTEDKRKNMKLVNRYKFLVGVLASGFALSFLFIVCLFGILASQYYPVLNEIISNNVTLIISTAIGIVITTILSGIAVHSKTKLIEGFDKNEEKK